jgi:hypothetical protein
MDREPMPAMTSTNRAFQHHRVMGWRFAGESAGRRRTNLFSGSRKFAV